MTSLTIVAGLLRHHRDPGPLQHVAPQISSFLGPPPCLSLSRACSLGSTKLLDWIWSSSPTSAASRPSTWSLHNFLRSDPHYNRDQFMESLKVAVRRKDLAVIKWLFAHFSGLEVPSDIMTLAASMKSLSILQFLLDSDASREGRENKRQKKRKVEANDSEMKKAEKMEPMPIGNHVVHWGENVLMSAVESECPQVVKWLHENVPLGDDERGLEQAVVFSLGKGSDEIAKILMPKGSCLLDYASSANMKVMELLLDCGYVKRDGDLASATFESLARFGRLDLMQQIVLLYSPPCQDSPLSSRIWRTAIEAACKNGYLTMLRWLLEHPLGREHRADLRLHRRSYILVHLAGRKSHVDIMQYVYDLSAADDVSDGHVVDMYEKELLYAILKDRYNVVKWLVENIPFSMDSYRDPWAWGIATAAAYQRLNILKLFHEMTIDTTPNGASQAHQVAAWWSASQQAMDVAAGNGSVEMLQWLLSKHPSKVTEDAMNRAACGGHLEMVQWLHRNRSEGCTEKAMDGAASKGHFDVVKWLHAHRSEGCTSAAMDEAAGNGHLEVVQWLHANRNEGCTIKAMDGAARCGHLNVIKWLHANRSEGCSAKAVRTAVDEGHLATLHWLHCHYPEHALTAINERVGGMSMFEMLLFLHVHFPQVITWDYVRQLNSNSVVSAWIADNYSSS
ncbi:Ankyrin repeats domain-containing protein [Phytophthora infestans]|uniref:Ankyrin repeats domain-containing protein n=1 Tax=Phytophthora infestans TaxID=4787 RepID=A0A8S9U1V4_PHYIN|nr:Ankyrin repeats domain-containing protein [Phytophthora infestans]KAF4132128.1 Ankyrin repeats domain-containing protein [Phytophthora infestans]